jgi:hypothetical protein
MRRLRAWILIPLALCACASPEILVPMTADVPPGIDFSGLWNIRPESLRDQPGIREAIDRTDGVDNRRFVRDRMYQQRDGGYGGHGNGQTKGGLVGIFLQTGDSLKITQTPDGLFISFDRAVVEEYRFGENRPVNIGQAQAHRVSGWDGNDYVIETLGEKGMKLTDRYSLADGNRRLVRHITLRSKKLEEVTIVQEFDRQGD